MAETFAAERVGFSGPPGPEMLRIPAEPAQLDQAAQQLGDLADHLVKSGEHLSGADGRHEDRKGHTTSALMHVAQWNGRTLVKDAGLLRELGEVVHHEGQLLGDIQAHDLPQLRRRWSQAQDQLVSELQQANAQAHEAQSAQHQNQGGQGHPGHQVHHGQPGDGPRREAHGEAFVAAQPVQQPVHQPDLPGPHAVLQHLDENLVAPYGELFRDLHGRHASYGAGHGQPGASLSDPRTEQAIGSYRQSVHSLLEEFSGLVQRVQQADRQVEEKIHRPEVDREEGDGAQAVAMGTADMVSGAAVLRHLVEDLRDGSQAADHAHDRLAGIARTLQDGRLPVRDGEERDGFRAEWEQHFARRAERLRTVCGKVDDVLEKFSRLDAECAAAIRAH